MQFTKETHYGKQHVAHTKMFDELTEKAGVADESANDVLTSLDSITDETLKRKDNRNLGDESMGII